MVSETKCVTLPDFINLASGDDLDAVLKESIGKALNNMSAPGSRDLFWRQYDMNCLLKKRWSYQASNKTVPSDTNIPDHCIVFYNGILQEQLSNYDDSVQIESQSVTELARDVTTRDYFSLLNILATTNRYAIKINQQESVKPLHIRHIVDADHAEQFVPVTLNIDVAEHVAVNIETSIQCLQDHPVWVNQSLSIVLHNQAQVNLCEYLDNHVNVFMTQTTGATIHAHAKLNQFIANKHMPFVYYDQNTDLIDVSAVWRLNGFYITHERDFSHYRLTAKHADKKTESHQFMRGLLSGQSKATFDSCAKINKGAAESVTYQMNNNLLLGDKTQVQSFPILEVDEDDVSCAHGSTIGAFDKQMLFYLQSRGLSVAESFSLLKRAFINEVIKAYGDIDAFSGLMAYIAKDSKA